VNLRKGVVLASEETPRLPLEYAMSRFSRRIVVWIRLALRYRPQVSATAAVGIIAPLDNVVGIGALEVSVCGFSSPKDVSARVIPSIFNNNNNIIIIIITLILVVG